MVESVQISQKFDILTPKIMFNIGHNYQLYISLLIIYDLVGSCKKFKKSDKQNLRYGRIGPNQPKI